MCGIKYKGLIFMGYQMVGERALLCNICDDCLREHLLDLKQEITHSFRNIAQCQVSSCQHQTRNCRLIALKAESIFDHGLGPWQVRYGPANNKEGDPDQLKQNFISFHAAHQWARANNLIADKWTLIIEPQK